MLSDNFRHKLMVDRLYLEVQYGRIDDDLAEKFICNVRSLLINNRPLSERQAAYLESLFERY